MPNLEIHATSPGTLQGGMSQVLLVTERAAAIAVDGQQRCFSSGKVTRTGRSISRIGDDLILTASGIYAATDGMGATVFDLHDSASIHARRLAWDDCVVDASRLALALGSQLETVARKLYKGTPTPLLKPHVSVLLAGVDKRNEIFAARIRFAGEWLIRGPFHALKLADPTVEAIVPSPGKFRAVLETRLNSLENQAHNVCAGHDPRILKYQNLLSLHKSGSTADEATLRGAASDLIQFTMDNDDHISGPIDVMSVRVRS